MTPAALHSAIAVTGLRKSFGDQVVLDGIDLDVAEGDPAMRELVRHLIESLVPQMPEGSAVACVSGAAVRKLPPSAKKTWVWPARRHKMRRP